MQHRREGSMPPTQALDTSLHQRRRAQRMRDPEYREAYERASREIEQTDQVIRALDGLRVDLDISKAELLGGSIATRRASDGCSPRVAPARSCRRCGHRRRARRRGADRAEADNRRAVIFSLGEAAPSRARCRVGAVGLGDYAADRATRQTQSSAAGSRPDRSQTALGNRLLRGA